jgi:hypothetical protein
LRRGGPCGDLIEMLPDLLGINTLYSCSLNKLTTLYLCALNTPYLSALKLRM